MERTPPLPPMLRSIIDAAWDMFPGHPWYRVEEHVRRAWNSVAHERKWEDVRDHARGDWERRSPP